MEAGFCRRSFRDPLAARFFTHLIRILMSMQTVIVIPARYGSSRLPGKPLVDILGKPLIQHVVERANQVRLAQRVIVATDDHRVVEVVRSIGGEAVMTAACHASGTDRLVEVMSMIPADLYVNLQGDEPLVRPEDIDLLIAGMADDETVSVGTLCHGIPSEEARNPHTVKVVLAGNGDALYFSRAPIPFPRDQQDAAEYLKHVGVYAYRREVLEQYGGLAQPMLEQAEKLEQLRLLYAGVRIRAFKVAPTGPGVDTPDCLARVRALIAGEQDFSQPRLAKIRLVITDVDGVLTDGGIYYDANGECQKRFHVRDGLGMRMLEECGIRVAVVSGRDSGTLRKRFKDLGIALFRFGVKDKAVAYREIMAEAGVMPEEAACIGDDSIDLPGFAVCGVSFAVADAPDYIKRAATHQLHHRGGEGAFREVADLILAAVGRESVFSSSEGFSAVMHHMAQ
jgi:3-deoxy-D-manno-octulosonate 8-phosphate phosphatase (KDO 8-P phosphatase)